MTGPGHASRRYPSRKPRPAHAGAPDPARRAALDTLRAVADRDAYANLVLPGMLRERGITGRDAAFASELAYGTLRGLGTYDAIIAACADRPLGKVDAAVLDVLRLGAHQLLAMRVPAHAAVSASVELARTSVGPAPTSFVNAVLRRVAARDLAGWLAELAPPRERDVVGHLAVTHAHPRWVVRAFLDALGGDLSGAEAALDADNLRPHVTLVARPGQSTRAELERLGATPGSYSPYAASLAGGDPGELAPVREGRAGVQDEGSQLVALALTRVPISGRDERWLDLASGPGGKSALLAGLAAERGASLLSVELQPHRARLVAQALAGAPGHHQVVVADGRVPPWRAGEFDRVLLDAPCTGLGALRRRPEARWRREPADVGRLAPLQRELLAAAVDAARRGGLVAYVTCSPHPGETRLIVADLLRERPDVVQLDARPYLPGVPDLGPGPHVQLWPHLHGTDAMFLALLQRP